MTGLDLERRVNRAVNAGDERLFLMEEALSVRSLPVAGPRGWWRDRLGFLRSALSSGLQVSRMGIPQVASTTVACFPGSATAHYRSARTFFVEHHFQERADCVGRGALRRPRRRPSASWRTWWLRGAWWAVLGFLDWSDRRYTWLGGALVDMQQFMRLRRDVRHVYVFALYDRRQYLLLTFLARHTPFALTAVYQTMPLARNCRHLHVQVPVALTSRVSLVEAEYYREQGSFLPSEVIYASQYNILDIHDLQPHEPTYDIGYYSSGEWARREGLYQVADADRIRAGEFEDNPYARAASDQLSALVDYAAREGRTLRIYPHPLERRLARHHNVQPPYAPLADGVTVTIDADGINSRRSMYDVRVAVSLQSSFIWERLDLGLEASYLHEFADPEMNVFERAALGRYAVNICPSAEDLIEKVRRAFAEDDRVSEGPAG